LVNRIQKNAVWGLGGQLLNFARKLNREGVVGNVESIKQYLLNQQTKDIYVHDFGPVLPHIRQWAIIASAYSSRHCYKVGADLKNSLNDRKDKKDYPAMMVGRKDDEWVLVEFKDITIHIMTEQERLEADLEWKWNNPVSEEVIEKYNKLTNHKSRGFFEPFDD
jgi:ribosomal silencing factor RsfS